MAASNHFADRGILYNSGPRVGYNKDDAHGFNKFGQRLVKLKLGDEDIGFTAKYGWQILHNYGVLAESYRSTSNSYFGYTGTFNYEKLRFEFAYVKDGMYRDSPDKKQFASKDYAKNLNHIITGAVVYKGDDFFLSYNYGSAADYKRMHILETSYKLTSDVKVGAQIYGSQAIGYYHQMKTKEFDSHAWHYAKDIQWTQPDWMLKAGIGYTDAPRKDGIGYYERNIAQYVRGRFEPMSETMQAYVRDGETVLTVMGTYNITEKYKTGFLASYAQLPYRGNTVRTGEINWINFWEPAKDFNVGIMFGYGWAYKHDNRTPVLDEKLNYKKSHLLSADFIVDYRFNLM
ncbi:hypothetical protein [Orbus mooreae]|uniref:hypothetical protein n=1 Tax=Orbus mooreae TaxID=3074107 RepID=UPI00370D61D6